MLPKPHRLRHTADIARVKKQGRSNHHPLLILLVQENGLAVSRFGFVASKRVGNAVVRNRRRRLMRESIRLHLPALRGGKDCLLIARQGNDSVTFAEMETAVSKLLRRTHILANG